MKENLEPTMYNFTDIILYKNGINVIMFLFESKTRRDEVGVRFRYGIGVS